MGAESGWTDDERGRLFPSVSTGFAARFRSLRRSGTGMLVIGVMMVVVVMNQGTNSLQGFAQAKVIGENTVQTVLLEEEQPVHALLKRRKRYPTNENPH